MNIPRNFFDASDFRYNYYFPFISSFPNRFAYRLANYFGGYQADKCQEAQSHIVYQMSQVLDCGDASKLAGYAAEFYRLASRDIIDTFKFTGYSKADSLDHVVATSGLASLVEYAQTGQNVVLTGAHFGRFWMAGLPIVAEGISVGTMTRDRLDENRYGLTDAEFAYRKKKLQVIAAAFNGPFLFAGDSIRKYFEAPEKLIMAMIFDVPLSGGSDRHYARVKFFGRTARFPAGIARLAKARNAMIFPYFMDESDGKLTARFLPKIDPNKYEQDEIMQILVSELEARIRNNPGHWWLWDALPIFLTES